MSNNKKILEESLKGEKKPKKWNARQNRAPFAWVATAPTNLIPGSLLSIQVLYLFFFSPLEITLTNSLICQSPETDSYHESRYNICTITGSFPMALSCREMTLM